MSEPRLHCADCMDALPKLESDSVSLVLTDIPYAEVNRDSGGLRSLDKDAADVLGFSLDDFIAECVRVCSGSFYIFCGFRQVSDLVREFDRHGLTVRSGIWRKTNPSPMNGERLWLSGVEHCVFARKANATFNERCKSAVWDAPSGDSGSHPTEKPLQLFQRLVLASTNEGDTVLDPCMGSGTTGVACVQTARRFIGIETNWEYFKIASKRIYEAPLTLFGDTAA